MARAHRKDRGLFEYRLADGTKCYGVRVWRFGKPYTKKGFLRKDEARQWYEDRRRDIREGRPLRKPSASSAALLTTVINTYLETAQRKKNYSGEQQYAAHWKQVFTGFTLPEVTPLLIDRERMRLLKRPVAPATVNRYVAWLHHVYHWAMDRELCVTNPCRLFVRSPKKGGQRLVEPPAPEQVWTDDELRRLADTLGEGILIPLLALLSGLRQDEQFSLRKDRIDWARACAYLDDPKAGIGQVVYFNPDALRILRYQVAKSGDSPWVYPSPRWPLTKHRNAQAWYDLHFKRAAKRAGLTFGRQHGKTWHTLRHSFADRLLDLKVHLKDVQGAGRWESMAAMQRYLKKRQASVSAGVALLASPLPLDHLIGTDTKPTRMDEAETTTLVSH